MPGNQAKLVKILAQAVRPLLGAAVGSGVGALENRYVPTGDPRLTPDWVKWQTVANNALIGALLGTRSGRQFFLGKRVVAPLDIAASGPLPWGVPIKATMMDRPSILKSIFFPGTAYTLGWGLPRLTAGGKEIAGEFPGLRSSPKFMDFFANLKEKPKEELGDILAGAGKKTMSNVVKDLIEHLKTEYPGALKALGMTAGGGLVGSVLGGELGGLAGNLLSGDEPRMTFTEKQKREERRYYMRTLGKILGGAMLSTAAPALYARYGGGL